MINLLIYTTNHAWSAWSTYLYTQLIMYNMLYYYLLLVDINITEEIDDIKNDIKIYMT